MIIDAEGEVILDKEDFKRAVRKASSDIPAERLYRGRKILVDDDIAERFEKLAEAKGIHVSKLVTATLKDYLEKTDIAIDIK